MTVNGYLKRFCLSVLVVRLIVRTLRVPPDSQKRFFYGKNL